MAFYEKLNKLRRLLEEGSAELTNGETSDLIAALDGAIADVKRMDLIDVAGIDWDGIGIYYQGKTIGCNSLRQGLDKILSEGE